MPDKLRAWPSLNNAACLEEVSQLIRNSDADGLVAAFSEEARSNDPELAAKAEKVMSLMGGGTLEESYFGEREGNIPSGSIRIISMATVVAPDGTKWQIHITDCTYDRDDPSRVGIRELQVIPYSDWDAPKGFGWHTSHHQLGRLGSLYQPLYVVGRGYSNEHQSL